VTRLSVSSDELGHVSLPNLNCASGRRWSLNRCPLLAGLKVLRLQDPRRCTYKFVRLHGSVLQPAATAFID